MSQIVQDLLKDVPSIGQPNIFPLEWHGDAHGKLAKLYETAKERAWNPAQAIDWKKLDPKDFTREQRLGVMYWYSVLANFDGSGPPVFAKAMIKSYETHEPNELRNAFFSIARDEVNHEEVCYRTVSRLWSQTPTEWDPQNDLEALALRNIRWLYYNGGRYWKGYSKALEEKYPMSVLFSSFMMGEVAATTLFHNMSKAAKHPVFAQGLKKVGQDEARHMAICLAALEHEYMKLTEEDKQMITKQLRAGFVFLSMILYEPPDEFWKLPPEFLEVHRKLEQLAREAGLGVATLSEKKQVWQEAMLKVKTVVNSYGVEFPAMPEVGITGKEVVNISMEDIIPVF
ncbi:hypothetical protein HYW46_04150 [Candidatus Daviesbacteria bacterium]|nr:hypothetical protein [Candidatus Daviesbacteria bacterium]